MKGASIYKGKASKHQYVLCNIKKVPAAASLGWVAGVAALEHRLHASHQGVEPAAPAGPLAQRSLALEHHPSYQASADVDIRMPAD